jgi:NADH-quinone oxidoreductase subunit L
MPDSSLIVLILFLPIFTFFVCSVLSNNKKNVAVFVFNISVFLGLIFSILLYLNNTTNLPFVQSHSWFNVANYQFKLAYLIDNYSTKMLILVNLISLMVAIFSIEYMRGDKAINRYYGFIGLFLFAMEGVILSANLFQMYLFWELVGFSSYLLIGFWYTKPPAIEASKKAFLMNRIGDVCLMIGIFMLFNTLGNTNFVGINNNEIAEGKSTIIGLLIFGGCMAKSAQFPLHTWLPDAMEGPTPVSALIHAATMVAAGIYLSIRISPLFTSTALFTITVIGCISMIMAGIKAILQSDIKKMLAYSTISQLGLMMVAIGGAAPNLAFNHLITHACFKAGLFLATGAIIYHVHKTKPNIDPQNMYLMGDLRYKIPVIFIGYFICAASMAGLPMFSGFVTKDLIIESWHKKSGIFNNGVLISLLLSTTITATYIGRGFYLIFLKKSITNDNQEIGNGKDSIYLLLPIIILAILSTFLTALFLKLPILHFNNIIIINTIGALIGLFLVYKYKSNLTMLSEYKSVFDKLYLYLFITPTVNVSEKISQFDTKIFDGATMLLTFLSLLLSDTIHWLDTSIIDGLVNKLASFVSGIGKNLTRIQSGQFQWYVSALLLLLLIVFWASFGL